MAKFTLHNKYGDFMQDTAKTLEAAKLKCDNSEFNCIVCETYYAKSSWKPWDEKLVEHGKEVYRNFH